jgi:hypothetical protein
VNLLHGVRCPPVICKQTGRAFQWRSDDGQWHSGDELPAEIANALPGPEWERCENHRYRVMGDARRRVA